MAPSLRPRPAVALALLAATIFFLVHAVAYRAYLLDDAYISLRYSRNLVEGHGLVFNPGERVEGYTNFSWVLLGSLFLTTGVGAMGALKGVSAIAALTVLGLLLRLEAHRFLLPPVIWLLASEGFAYYATTGMETMFFTALATAAVLLSLREATTGRWSGSIAAFLLLALTRPEGLYLLGLCQAGGAVLERVERGAWGWRRRLADGAVFAITYGGYFAWRYAYYGEPLPNTFHAKVTGGGEQLWGGLLSLWAWAAAHPVLALALLAPAVFWPLSCLWPLSRRSSWPVLEARLWILWGIALGWVVYAVAVGGDSFPFYRFFLPVMPLAAILASGVLGTAARVWPALGRRSDLVVWMLLLVDVGAGFLSEQPMRAFVADRTTRVGLEAGRHLAAERPVGDLLAVNTAGALPYASRLPALDMLGLTEPAIARHDVYVISPRWAGHRRGWGEYVLSRRPALIFWYNAAGSREPHYLGDHQLADDPIFRFFYQLRQERLPTAGPPEKRLARFLGTPFGDGDAAMIASDLGTRFEVRPRPMRHTVAYEGPIVLNYFERRGFAGTLWPLVDESGGDLDRFLDAAIRHWRAESARPVDAGARRRVDAWCREAAAHAEAGRVDRAKDLLSRAAALNDRARSPLVGQYVANLAVLERSLFLAVQAQLEALRLAPDNPLYRGNLRSLLTVSYREFTR